MVSRFLSAVHRLGDGPVRLVLSPSDAEPLHHPRQAATAAGHSLLLPLKHVPAGRGTHARGSHSQLTGRLQKGRIGV